MIEWVMCLVTMKLTDTASREKLMQQPQGAESQNKNNSFISIKDENCFEFLPGCAEAFEDVS